MLKETEEELDARIQYYEQLNSEKPLFRATTDRMPNSLQLQKDTGIPIGVVVKPYGDHSSGEPHPEISFKDKPIVRCDDCRAYINPFVRFYDDGTKWLCNFCSYINNTPQYYY